MSITVRTRKLQNGSRSLYLDFYEKGKRWTENLNLAFVPEVNEDAKRINENAMKKAVAIKAERVLGKMKEPEEEQLTPLLSDWMQTYLNKLAKNIKPDSLRHHTILVRTINEYLESRHKSNLHVSQFSKTLYKGFLAYLKDEYTVKRGKNEYKLHPTTLFNKQRQLDQLLNAAVKDGQLSENPGKQIEKGERYKKSSRTIEYLTIEEVKKMAEAPTHSERTKIGFLFCCFTGLRLSDLQALTWGNIQYTAHGMEIRMQMQKTKIQLVIPLNRNALKWMPERNGKDKLEKVFDLPERTTCRTRVKALAKRVGITKNINFHTSRHTFATLSLAAGIDLYTVSKLLGHTNIKTTQIYADVLAESKYEAVSKVNGLFE